MTDLNLVWQSLKYIIDVPYFWGSMGFTTAIAMFAGVLLYDGQLDQIMKGLVSVISYASMLLWITLSRVVPVVNSPDYSSETPHFAYAGIATIAVVTLAWLIGLIFGVSMFRLKYGKHGKVI